MTFNFRGKRGVRLVFHCGVKKSAAGDGPFDGRSGGRLVEDPEGMLEWAADDRGVAEFVSVEDVARRAKALEALVRAWCAAAG